MNTKKSKRNKKSTIDKRTSFEINKTSFKSHLHHFCVFFICLFFANHITSQAPVTSSVSENKPTFPLGIVLRIK